MIYVPKVNDLIIFTQPTSAILSDYGIGDKRYNWSQSIVNVDSDQSALVIDSYTIDNNQSNRSFTNPSHNNTLNVAIELTKHHHPQIPQPPTILIVSLSTLLLEVLFDPDLINTFTHPTNYVADIKPSVYLMMAR